MNHVKKILVVLFLSLLSACATEVSLGYRTYSEHVKSVLVTQDQTSLIFVGPEYHYIFTLPNVLKETFTSSFYPSLTATFKNFTVDSSGTVSGEGTLILSVNTPEDQKVAAAAIGYSCRTMQKGGEYCKYPLTMHGTRYKANYATVANQQMLNKDYYINVQEEYASKEGAKPKKSPITIAENGALVIGALPLIVVGTVILGVACSSPDACH